MDLAQACVDYRARNGLTQEELAKLAGVTRFTIINLERGKNLRAVTAAKLRILFEEGHK